MSNNDESAWRGNVTVSGPDAPASVDNCADLRSGARVRPSRKAPWTSAWPALMSPSCSATPPIECTALFGRAGRKNVDSDNIF